MTNFFAATELGLTLAMPKVFFTTYGPFDEAIDNGAGLDILDWVLRAGQAGAPITIWHGPAASTPAHPREPVDTAAARRFTERWAPHIL